jgi:hypothetical protein
MTLGIKPGHNPVRRNRNIGTARQGHGQNNRLVIPSICAGERHWAETLHAHHIVLQRIRSHDITFIIEACRRPFTHACSIEDVEHVLSHVPLEDWGDIETFVLRQSTRKQCMLRRAWGCIYYSADRHILR